MLLIFVTMTDKHRKHELQLFFSRVCGGRRRTPITASMNPNGSLFYYLLSVQSDRRPCYRGYEFFFPLYISHDQIFTGLAARKVRSEIQFFALDRKDLKSMVSL
jgi:hypothetical protein